YNCDTGGLRAAFERSSATGRIVQSFDWDQAARQVYESNYGPGSVQQVDIGTLSASQLPPSELWLLSPSCQPYTVLNPDGKGEGDPRAKSFLHLVDNVLPELARLGRLPRYLLIENVAGFESSTTRQKLLSTFQGLDYSALEVLLTPLQFGIPNSRLRYYCLAKLSPLRFAHMNNTSEAHVWRHIPGQGEDWKDPRDSTVPAIPDKVLMKWGHLFDIVKPSSRRTCCFTRGYTHLVERAGSILQTNESLDVSKSLSLDTPHPSTDPLSILRPLGLRYFSPTELLRLFCFLPPAAHDTTTSQEAQTTFKWPLNTSTKTKYRLIGNSVNVEVVRRLINYLVLEPPVEKIQPMMAT
ncbi:S-adenosyl-L-methionine-dependent methyltransferase, partial [Gloeophyllum trabeum ATCC 11539]